MAAIKKLTVCVYTRGMRNKKENNPSVQIQIKRHMLPK